MTKAPDPHGPSRTADQRGVALDAPTDAGVPSDAGAAQAAPDAAAAGLDAQVAALSRQFAGYPGPALLFDNEATPYGLNAAGAELAARLASDGGVTTMPHLVQLAVKARIAGKGMVREVPLADDNSRLEATVLPQADGTLLMLGRNATLDANIRTALAESRTRFKDLVELAADFAWETDAEGRFTYISPRGALGYDPEALTGRSADSLLVDPDSAPSTLPFSCREPTRNVELWLVDAEGASRCLQLSAAPVRDARGRRTGARGIAMDVTAERVQQNELSQLKTRERLVQYILDALRGEADPEDMMTAAAEALARALSAQGCVLRIVEDGTRLVEARFGEVPPDAAIDAAAAEVERQRALAEGAAEGRRWLGMAAHHHSRPIGLLSVWKAAEDADWSPEDRALLQAVERHFGIAFRQIADQLQLERLSRTDELTGLSNRRAFFEDVAESLERCQRRGEPGALLYIDLDHFKPINDTHGHEAGDRLLIALAERLEAATRTYDRTARLGGDEFAVWMEGADEAAACRRADGFLAAIAEEAAAYGELDPPLGASIGIAPFDPSRRGPHGAVESLDSLLARSDAAMYAAKRAGKGRRAVAAPFDPGAESEAESGANSGPGAAGDGGDAERNQGPETA